jgi:nicotinate-nucleotide adenylyltransferase
MLGGECVLAIAVMKRIGLLGGSFNPAHSGHRAISLAAIQALGLDEVWWLVSPGNPLKERAHDMAAFEARFASARAMARRAPIRVSDFERRAGTRYTVDTVAKLQRRYPNFGFIWLMGADTVAQFHHWRHWRKLAESLPIAVIHRPGYDHAAHAARAMGWLRRFVRPSGQARCWTDWSAPAILLLRLPPDPTSATALRAHDPNWHRRYVDPKAGSKRFALPTSLRRALARPSH